MTIKQVAEYAKVSVGTVSNVLNGKTNNAELIDRVEKAMKELSYRPDPNARNLKNTRTSLIGVVVPNLTNPDYTLFLQEVEGLLQGKGYQMLLKLSQNNTLLEKKGIEQCFQQSVEGIILYSSVVKNVAYLKESEETPSVLISRKMPDQLIDSIILDYKKALNIAVVELHQKGAGRIGIILEQGYCYDIDTLLSNKDLSIPVTIEIVDHTMERGFEAAYKLFSNEKSIDAMVVGNFLIAQGVEKARQMLGLEPLPMVVLKSQNWLQDENKFLGVISTSHKKVAEMAVRSLMEAIESPNSHEGMIRNVEAEFVQSHALLSNVKPKDGVLRIAMFDCPAAQGLKMLAQTYARKTNTQISFEFFKYSQLETTIYQNRVQQSADFDAYMIDITWLESMAEQGCLFPISPTPEDSSYLRRVLNEYSLYNEQLYALPFMSGTQLLFYQRDLFEDQMLGRQFKRLYGEELAVPATWSQFNLVSEFFTRSINEKSPVNYGSVQVRGENVFTTISFLNRLWSYGSDIYDAAGNVIINNSNSVAALSSLVQSFQFSTSQTITNWDEATQQFMAGNSAMTILYDSHAYPIYDYTKSKVAGNVGVAPVPGRTSVLGGWSMGVSPYSSQKEQVLDFLRWACGNSAYIPLSLLGGSPLQKDNNNHQEMENMYPWRSFFSQSVQDSRKRLFSSKLNGGRLNNEAYARIIPREIMLALQGEISEKEAIMNIESQLMSMIHHSNS